MDMTNQNNAHNYMHFEMLFILVKQNRTRRKIIQETILDKISEENKDKE